MKGQWLNPQNTVAPKNVFFRQEDAILLRAAEDGTGERLQTGITANKGRNNCGNRDLDIVVITVASGNHDSENRIRATVKAVMEFVIDFAKALAVMLFTVAVMLPAGAAVAQNFASGNGNVNGTAVVAAVHIKPY